jgi:hypothetical protein
MTSWGVPSFIVIPIPPWRERDPTGAVALHKVDCVSSSEKARSFAVFAAQDDNAGSGVAPVVIPSVARDPASAVVSHKVNCVTPSEK